MWAAIAPSTGLSDTEPDARSAGDAGLPAAGAPGASMAGATLARSPSPEGPVESLHATCSSAVTKIENIALVNLLLTAGM
jgi:hypothetical protein